LSDTLTGVKPLKAMAKHVRVGALFAVDARALNKAMRRQVLSREAMRNLQDPLLGVFLCVGIYIAVTYIALPITQFIVMAALLMKIVQTINKALQSYQAAAMAESASGRSEIPSPRPRLSASRQPACVRRASSARLFSTTLPSAITAH
jgi:ATP-binding cassette subfamily C protein